MGSLIDEMLRLFLILRTSLPIPLSENPHVDWVLFWVAVCGAVLILL
jgi:hypothetical protein